MPLSPVRRWLEHPRCFHLLRPGRESWRNTAPAQRLDLLEKRRISAQSREILVEQREIALVAENGCRARLGRTVAVQKRGGGPGAIPGMPG